MRTVMPASLILLLVPLAAPAQSLAVVPNQFASVEGNSASSSFYQNGAASVQAYYSESFLSAAGIAPGSAITGIAYRRAGGGSAGPTTDISYASYNIFLSASFADGTPFTNTFANNVVGTQIQVRSGALTVPAGSVPAGATPNAFGPIIDFSTPYEYTGGSLLFEIRRSARVGGEAFNTDIDNSTALHSGARWMFNTTSDAALTGTVSNGAQIFQVRYAPVPEPSGVAFVGAAAAAAWFARRGGRPGRRAQPS